MKSFTCVEGQSIFDICLNTYGSFNNIVKLMQDSSFDNLNKRPLSGNIFTFDETLVLNPNILSVSLLPSVKYATIQSNNGSQFQNNDNTSGGTDMAVKYQKTDEAQYTAAADGETTISLPGLIGASIIHIDKEIKPLKLSQWSWNSSSGTLSLQGGLSLAKGETIFIIWGIIITS